MFQTQLIISPKLKHKIDRDVNIVNVVLFAKISLETVYSCHVVVIRVSGNKLYSGLLGRSGSTRGTESTITRYRLPRRSWWAASPTPDLQVTVRTPALFRVKHGYSVPVCAPCEDGTYRTSSDRVTSRCVPCRGGSYLPSGKKYCRPCGPNTNTGGRPAISAHDCGESNSSFTLHGTGYREQDQWVPMQKCSHWSETGKRARTHCFLLYWSLPFPVPVLVPFPCSVNKP